MNSASHFKWMRKDEETRHWLEECIKAGSEVFMIIGIHTVCDATITKGREASSKVAGAVQIPLNELATSGATSLFPTIESGSAVGVNGSASVGSHTKLEFISPGEQVVAVQYRQLRFKWYSSRSVDAAFLDHHGRWKVQVIGNRSEKDPRNFIDDVIEVELKEFINECFEDNIIIE